MTLSTPAEHAFGDECDRVRDEVEVDVSPQSMAEEFVMEIEGTEANPVEINDPKARARELADVVESDAEYLAGCYTDSDVVAESVAEELGSEAFDEVVEAFRHAPTVEVVGR